MVTVESLVSDEIVIIFDFIFWMDSDVLMERYTA